MKEADKGRVSKGRGGEGGPRRRGGGGRGGGGRFDGVEGKGKTMKGEAVKKTSIGWSVYLYYFRAMSLTLVRSDIQHFQGKRVRSEN